MPGRGPDRPARDYDQETPMANDPQPTTTDDDGTTHTPLDTV